MIIVPANFPTIQTNMNTNAAKMSPKDKAAKIKKTADETKNYFSKFKVKKKKAKADFGVVSMDCCDEEPEVTSEDIQYINDRLGWMQRDLDSLWSQLNEHENDGHLPELTFDQLKKAMELLGISPESVQIQPQVIYANDGSPQKVILEISK